MMTESNVVTLSGASLLHPALVAVGAIGGAALAGPLAGVAVALVGLRLGAMFSAAAAPHEARAPALQHART